jgi:hypothetical protein
MRHLEARVWAAVEGIGDRRLSGYDRPTGAARRVMSPWPPTSGLPVAAVTDGLLERTESVR